MTENGKENMYEYIFLYPGADKLFMIKCLLLCFMCFCQGLEMFPKCDLHQFSAPNGR